MPKPALPSATRLWNAATAYEEAADTAFAKLRSPRYVGFISIAVIFLYLRSIELSLKACLRECNVDSNTLAKTLGHRLDKILARADQWCIHRISRLLKNA